jgi:hypothetical protein
MVHVGYAIQKMSEQEAQSSWELLDEMVRLQDEANAQLAIAVKFKLCTKCQFAKPC